MTLNENTPIDELEVSARVYNRLVNNGVKTVGDARKLSDNDFLRFYNFGRKSLRELRDLIGQDKRLDRFAQTGMTVGQAIQELQALGYIVGRPIE